MMFSRKLLPNSEKLFTENIFTKKLFCYPKIYSNYYLKKFFGTIRAIRNLKKRTTNGGSWQFEVVRKLDNMYFFILDKCFQINRNEMY